MLAASADRTVFCLRRHLSCSIQVVPTIVMKEAAKTPAINSLIPMLSTLAGCTSSILHAMRIVPVPETNSRREREENCKVLSSYVFLCVST